MKKDLIEIFDIKENDIISITGSGGKTTLMFELASMLKEKGSTLISTSTKIRCPKENDADYIFSSYESYEKKSYKNKVVVIGDLIKEKNKLKGIDKDKLIEISKDFSYTIIEADGSRNLPLKYWKDYEPVIYKETTKAIGVFCVKVLDKFPNSDFIYNYDDYIKNIGKDKIDKEILEKLIKSKPGIFGEFKGKKIIYINQADNIKEQKLCKEICSYLKEKFEDIDFVYGSLLKEEYYEN